MPITKNAQKAMRSSERKRLFNLRRTRKMRAVVKEVRDMAGAGQLKEAMAKLPEAYQAIDKAAKRGVIKDNTAARKKSRLNSYLKGLATKK
ncbi:30S ribosomal protein S20 [Patescibacteria group bacterium]|jgi:small subunit ribosomal protein S20|nr:30S ribosomal protein S20 [Patescibacteria group bacterium]